MLHLGIRQEQPDIPQTRGYDLGHLTMDLVHQDDGAMS